MTVVLSRPQFLVYSLVCHALGALAAAAQGQTLDWTTLAYVQVSRATICRSGSGSGNAKRHWGEVADIGERLMTDTHATADGVGDARHCALSQRLGRL